MHTVNAPETLKKTLQMYSYILPFLGSYRNILLLLLSLASRGFLITHNDMPQSVGLLWTSDWLVAEAST
jgi:hypothetical protein